MSSHAPPFWKHKSLGQMSSEEWESLCDGCAKCCLYRLEDEDTQEVYFTNVHCRLLDTCTGRCTDYANRSVRVPDCVTITPAVLQDPYWLPRTCAYRVLAEGRELARWHPLISGDPDSVVRAGLRVCDRTICEDDADELENHLVDWIE
ncbi:MAG: YcgN family cysteine cluster protein [Chromatiaceae bacterium]|jgi:hypothetical protein|nr:YcgN family cysteine cluster protein [Chromatiaceae bacterium]